VLKLQEVDTPGKSSVEDVSRLLNIPESCLIKTLIYKTDSGLAAVLIRGDKRLNEAKLAKALEAKKLLLANETEIEKATGGPLGYSGPVGLKNIKIIADELVGEMSNAAAGANKKDTHYINVNINRDFKVDGFYDLRYIDENDICPKCGNDIEIKRAMEVGHIFKLGTKYTESLNVEFLDDKGNKKPIIMGCYGIGINRLLAAIIELNHDDKGIIWSKATAPFAAEILLLDESEEAASIADEIYNQVRDEGFDVLYDDRKLQAGVKFKDADLIGLPIQIIIGSKGLKKGQIEVKDRNTNQREAVSIENAALELKKILTM
jgi:prolyl-tRNA synthetase